MVHIHNGILSAIKKKCIWVSSNEVDELEPIIQSEVSQKEKEKYHILMYIYGILNYDTDEFICKATIEK